jgi:hypothetical protein
MTVVLHAILDNLNSDRCAATSDIFTFVGKLYDLVRVGISRKIAHRTSQLFEYKRLTNLTHLLAFDLLTQVKVTE